MPTASSRARRCTTSALVPARKAGSTRRATCSRAAELNGLRPESVARCTPIRSRRRSSRSPPASTTGCARLAAAARTLDRRARVLHRASSRSSSAADALTIGCTTTCATARACTRAGRRLRARARPRRVALHAGPARGRRARRLARRRLRAHVRRRARRTPRRRSRRALERRGLTGVFCPPGEAVAERAPLDVAEDAVPARSSDDHRALGDEILAQVDDPEQVWAANTPPRRIRARRSTSGQKFVEVAAVVGRAARGGC